VNNVTIVRRNRSLRDSACADADVHNTVCIAEVWKDLKDTDTYATVCYRVRIMYKHNVGRCCYNRHLHSCPSVQHATSVTITPWLRQTIAFDTT
jgi:hypothetical protein